MITLETQQNSFGWFGNGSTMNIHDSAGQIYVCTYNTKREFTVSLRNSVIIQGNSYGRSWATGNGEVEILFLEHTDIGPCYILESFPRFELLVYSRTYYLPNVIFPSIEDLGISFARLPLLFGAKHVVTVSMEPNVPLAVALMCFLTARSGVDG